MKTVKTLHFDSLSFGVSISVSFGYTHNQSFIDDLFVHIQPLGCKHRRFLSQVFFEIMIWWNELSVACACCFVTIPLPHRYHYVGATFFGIKLTTGSVLPEPEVAAYHYSFGSPNKTCSLTYWHIWIYIPRFRAHPCSSVGGISAKLGKNSKNACLIQKKVVLRGHLPQSGSLLESTVAKCRLYSIDSGLCIFSARPFPCGVGSLRKKGKVLG